MKQLDRYLLSQFMVLFGFFALVLVSVYWMNRAVQLFDRLISDGQTAWVVLEFTALTLPNVIRAVLPVAAFAATVTAINRLSQDSEFVVMKALGVSPWRLSVAALSMGLIVALMMSALVHFLVPASRARLADRQAELWENVTARFLTEGSFQHPISGVTIYIREITELGELKDLFLSDRRSAARRTNYTAERALIVKSDTGPKLVMFDGMAQTLRSADMALSITRFSSFTYDIGALISHADGGLRAVDEVPTPYLLSADPAIRTLTGTTDAQIRAALHERFAQPLLAPAAVLIGFSLLMLGSFSRFGLWRQIGVAVVALIVLNIIATSAGSAVSADPSRWPLHYVAPLIGMLFAIAVTWLAGRPRRLRPPRKARIAEAGA